MLSESAFWRRWTGLGLIVLSAGTLALAVDGRRDQREAVQCQTKFFVAFSKASQSRAEFAASQSDATTSLLAGLGRLVAIDPKSPKQAADLTSRYRALFADYAEISQRVDAKRATTPLPVLPEKCSEVQSDDN